MPVVKEPKVIELWDGYEVTVDEGLMNDFDFMSELVAVKQDGNVADMVEMYMAVVGGNKTYEDIRAHLTAEHGRVTVDGIADIIEKIDSAFPKSGNRVQRRSWKSTR